MSDSFRSILDILQYRSQEQPNSTSYIFLQDGETETSRLTYEQLNCHAIIIATYLQSKTMVGDRVLLLYPPGLEFISAFFGCLYAGLIAVPAYPPTRNHSLSRLLSISDDAQAKIALTTTSILNQLNSKPKQEKDLLTQLDWVATDNIKVDTSEFIPLSITSDSLAFLQYTSGSTGIPKGVMVTHANIIYNLKLIQKSFSHSDETIFVGWLPLFHDMGLIGNVLQPMYLGISSILMPPVAFLQKPIRWLKSISKYQATTSGGPNFAYDLCVKKIKSEQLTDLDLSSWDLAFNGAEPIRAETLEQFSKKFKACGFDHSAFYPCYGMAESTLLITGGDKSKSPLTIRVGVNQIKQNSVVESYSPSIENKVIVGCGCPDKSTTLIIVDPKTLCSCKDGQVGEIWLSGKSVASGYWNRPQASKETFQARLQNKEGEFLRTGDLGFLKDEELFVTGRIKDLIIIRGQNHYPQDIELTVQKSHLALRLDCGAAFSIKVNGEEKLMIVQEVKRSYLRTVDTDEVFKAIYKSIVQEHKIQVYGIALLKTTNIPKTSSGKIQRHVCRQLFIEGSLKTIAIWKADNFTSSQSPINISYISKPNSPVNQNILSNNKMSMHEETLKKNSDKRADDLINWLREYTSERINSRLIDERRCIPPYIVLDFGNQGIMGMQVPEIYGGLELRNSDLIRVIEQLGAIDLSLATFVGINNALGIRPIQKYATQAVKDELLPILARGRQLASFAITEPGAGSAVREISSRAIPNHKGGWHLHGTKIWSGSSSWAGVISAFVKQYNKKGQPVGMTGFVVRQGLSGLRLGPEALTMGMRGLVQNTMYFDNVPVNSADLLGESGKGMIVAQDIMMFARLGIAAMSIGGLKRCAQLMQRYASRRKIATGILLDNPLTLARLSDVTAATTAAETFVNLVANFLDAGKPVPEEAFVVCKTSAPEFLWQAVDWAVQLLGGRGYIESNIIPQIFRDARLFRTFEGPTETLNMHLGSCIMRESTTLFTFLIEELQASAIATRLRDVAAHIKSRCLSDNSLFSDRASAIRWTQILVGEIATYGFLLAAVKYQLTYRSSSELHRASEWTRLQFEQAIRKALVVSPVESVLLNVNSATELISNYAQTIGDIEQTLPGEEHELNELLRKSSDDFLRANQPTDSDTQQQNDKQINLSSSLLDVSELDLDLPTTDTVKQWMIKWLINELKLEPRSLDFGKSFADYGLDSVMAVEFAQDLSDWLGVNIDPTIAWNFPTIDSLAVHLTSKSSSEILSPSTKNELELEKVGEDDVELSIAEGLDKLETLLTDN